MINFISNISVVGPIKLFYRNEGKKPYRFRVLYTDGVGTQFITVVTWKKDEVDNLSLEKGDIIKAVGQLKWYEEKDTYEVIASEISLVQKGNKTEAVEVVEDDEAKKGSLAF